MSTLAKWGIGVAGAALTILGIKKGIQIYRERKSTHEDKQD